MPNDPAPSRILIIRPSALGDVCRTVPVLASLRAAYPQAHIAWLVQRGFEPAIAHHPALNEVIPFDRNRMAIKRLWTSSGRDCLHDLIGRLRHARFDLVLDCQGLGRSAFFTQATRAPVRVGHKQARECAWLAYSRRVDSPTTRHTVDRMLDLVRELNIPIILDMRLYPGPAAETWADTTLGPAATQPRTVLLAPTSRWAGKRWPIDRFTALAEQLLGENTCTPTIGRLLIVGGPAERDQCAPLLALADRDPRVIDLIGGTTVDQLLAAIGRADLVIANDSAAIHMAVGMGRPLIGLFGPTRIDLVGPYGRSEDVIQAKTPEPGQSHKDEAGGRAMMELIGLDAVLSRCAALLGGEESTPI